MEIAHPRSSSGGDGKYTVSGFEENDTFSDALVEISLSGRGFFPLSAEKPFSCSSTHFFPKNVVEVFCADELARMGLRGWVCADGFAQMKLFLWAPASVFGGSGRMRHHCHSVSTFLLAAVHGECVSSEFFERTNNNIDFFEACLASILRWAPFEQPFPCHFIDSLYFIFSRLLLGSLFPGSNEPRHICGLFARSVDWDDVFPKQDRSRFAWTGFLHTGVAQHALV